LTAAASGALALCQALHAHAEAQSQAQPPLSPPSQPQSNDPNAPIVSDQQFESQLPALDPELNRPLEPIESLDLPPAPPAVPGVQSTVPPTAVTPDPALAEPLPPLATFDVTTPPAGTEEEAKPASVRYALVVEGLKQVDLEGRFRELSALEDGDGEATNGAQIAARAREDEALAIRIRRSDGA
jgi:translocation and assembly module TamA